MNSQMVAAEGQPFLTSGLTGIGGRIKVSPEDFRVEERPLYLPCGDGEHLYVRITKRGLSTPDLVLRLSSVLWRESERYRCRRLERMHRR